MENTNNRPAEESVKEQDILTALSEDAGSSAAAPAAENESACSEPAGGPISVETQDPAGNSVPVETQDPAGNSIPVETQDPAGDSAELSVIISQKNNALDPALTPADPPEEPEDPVIPPLPLPDPVFDYRGSISAFGFSQQGESHLKKDVPCQDRSGLRFLSDSLVIAALADGVGSCALSDYGSSTAVNSVLDYLENALTPMLSDPNFRLSAQLMGKLLREMMQHAYNRVQDKAQEMEQLLYSFQSTLTVAVYDGKTLFFAHAGDDGIVALTQDGKCEMATTRHKGEEASSVYPLQSTNTWQYGMVDNVPGFVMATDGVLDAFVRSEVEKNRVYYPFIEPALTPALTCREDVQALCNEWYDYMKSQKYRAFVTDDLSFVCIANQAAMKSSVKPAFDMDLWNKQTQEYEARRKAALYPSRSQQPENTAKPRSEAQNTAGSQPQRPADAAGQGSASAHSSAYRQSRPDANSSQGQPRDSGFTGRNGSSRSNPPYSDTPYYGDAKEYRKKLWQGVTATVDGVTATVVGVSGLLRDTGEFVLDNIRVLSERSESNREARKQSQNPPDANGGNFGGTGGKP